jgi:hypothetical protein
MLAKQLKQISPQGKGFLSIWVFGMPVENLIFLVIAFLFFAFLVMSTLKDIKKKKGGR